MAQAQETPKAALAFEAYCDLGPGNRSLRALADKTGTKLSQLGVWSRTYEWVARASAFDKEQVEKERRKREREEDQKRRKKEAEIEAMNERHASIGVTQQKLAIEHLKRLADANAIGPYAAVQLLKLATDLERVARGEPTEHTQVTGNVGVSIYLPEKQTLPEGQTNGDSES